MANLSNIKQAGHNEQACDYLRNSGIFSDWVITTAFYASIHYVRHYIIPYDDDGRIYTSFETLYEDKKEDHEGRHGFQLNLVKRNCPSIRYQYQRLWDMSVNARYHNYKYEKTEATMAKKYLDDVKEFVLNNKPKP